MSVILSFVGASFQHTQMYVLAHPNTHRHSNQYEYKHTQNIHKRIYQKENTGKKRSKLTDRREKQRETHIRGIT